MWLNLSLSFLVFVELLQCIDCFSWNWESFVHYFFKYSLCSFSSLYFCVCVFPIMPVSHCVYFGMLNSVPQAWDSAPCSLFWFCSVLQTGQADLSSGLLIVSSAGSPMLMSPHRIFHISYCTFQCQNFYFILLIISITLLILHLVRHCVYSFI